MTTAARNIPFSPKLESPTSLKLVPPADLFQRTQQLYESIARRAFEIFESNGRALGHDLDDWFKAESELLHPVRIEIADSEREITLHAEVPGFAATELQVSVEPHKVTITGKRENKEERKDKKTVYAERSFTEMLRTVELPAAVETEKAKASLNDGVLELKLPKAPPAKKIEIVLKEAKQDEQC